MKVLLATHFFPPNHPGGTEAYTLTLAREMLRRGCSPHVICAERWGAGSSWRPSYEDTLHEGVPVRRLYWNWQLAPNPFVNFYDNPEVERHFAEHVRRVRPDVMHATSCYALGARIFGAARREGVPTFLTLTDFWLLCHRHTLYRGDGSLCTGPESAVACQECIAYSIDGYRMLTRVVPRRLAAHVILGLSRWPRFARLRGLRGNVGNAEHRYRFLRRAFEDVDVAISPSRFLIEMFARNGYPTDRFRLSRHGLDTSWVSRVRTRDAHARPRVGYIGQIDPVKGVGLLVQAFLSIAAEVSAELRIYGDLSRDPVFSSHLRRLVDGNPDIRLMGPFERNGIADVLSELDFVVMPSFYYENSPVSIAEAFAARRPVIATNLGGMSEMVEHGVNGLLFERGDVRGLAEAMRALIEDTALRERLRLGIKPVRSIEDEVDQLLDMYRVAVEDGSTRITASEGARIGR